MTVADRTVTVTSQGETLGSAALPDSRCTVDVFSDHATTRISAGGGAVFSSSADIRPQVVGIYSDLDAVRDRIDGVRVDITPDTRFQTSPGALKLTAIVLAVLATVASIAVLVMLEHRSGRSRVRGSLRRWIKPTIQDLAVVGVLAVWIVIGVVTADDGYTRSIVEIRDDTGYIGNYYRWFNVSEAPFGWPYEFYAKWIQVSTSPIWLRLPAALIGLGCWLLISREVLPRLGPAVRRSRAAGWAAAMALLAFWLPYNNGTRLEPVVALGTLMTFVLVERCIATRRLSLLAVSLFAAGLTVAAAPTGFIAVAPFVVGLVPLWRLLRFHARSIGWIATLLPPVAAGLAVLTVIFADQTLAAVLEATRVRRELGPSLTWKDEIYRYELLFAFNADGSLTRRFPMVLLVLCIATCVCLLIRRRQLPGTGLGPSRRLVGTSVVAMVLLAFTPTKWTHHFGAFASLAAAMAALTVVATSPTVLRSVRNRWWFAAALLTVLAITASAPNTPWAASRLGVPWNDMSPAVGGYEASSALIVMAAAAAAVAAYHHVRDHQAPGTLRARPVRSSSTRYHGLLSAPLAVVCALMVLAQVGAMTKAIYAERDGYSLGGANLDDLTGSDCGLTERVLVEENRGDGALAPLVPAPSAPRDTLLTSGFAPGPGAASEEDPPPGIGTAQIPVWTKPAGSSGELRTPWYSLAPGALDDRPLVVAAAGDLGDGVSVVAEFADSGPAGMRVVDQADIGAGRATADGSGWRDYRIEMRGRPGGAAQAVRLVVQDQATSSGTPLTISAPRVPRLQPLIDLLRGEPVMMDWPTGFVHPCVRPFGIEDGIAEIPRYRLAADRFGFGIAEAWSSEQGGGPFGWIDVFATEREVPTYLRNSPDDDWGRLLALDPQDPDAVPARVRTASTRQSGFWSPGPLN